MTPKQERNINMHDYFHDLMAYNDLSREEALSTAAHEYGVKLETASRIIRKLNEDQRPKKVSDKLSYKDLEEYNEVLAKDNLKLQQGKQRAMDNLRISRKQTRERARLDNAVGAFAQALNDTFRENPLHERSKKHKVTSAKKTSVAILHLSDVHFNELVDLPSNKYDFEIASIRLKLLVTKAKRIWKGMGVEKVVVAMTGDMLNSDRRLDELLSLATNRSRATFLAVDILQQLILDVNEDYNVSVAYIAGNEGRVNPELGWSDIIATDNYDTTIFLTLKALFKGAKGIDFIIGNPCELVINVAGQNVLMMHGHGGLGGNLSKAIIQVMGRYSAVDIKLDYVIFGHIHEAIISDNFSRSSSLVGNNAYSDRALGLSGRASQNTYIFNADGTREGVKIDLQVIDGEGYDIDASLQEFNTKSVGKLHSNKVVFQVVI